MNDYEWLHPPQDLDARRRSQQAAGERVLADAVRLAADTWGDQLLAAYALGSLAHGGFSAHVSDVDLGLVLSDPLHVRDTHAIEAIANTVKARGAPLADRLSVFWGSPATLSGEAAGGRFPPLDRLDLAQFGRLLRGQDLRAHLALPTTRELVIAGADFALQVLATPEVVAELRHPALLVNAGVRVLTKTVLFPVRFLFTARTGQVGRNDAAVEHFTAAETGLVADLARSALRWREEPPDPGDPMVVGMLEWGLIPLYRLFLDEYAVRLREYGEGTAAHALEEWRQSLT
jgi:hypothetical protein